MRRGPGRSGRLGLLAAAFLLPAFPLRAQNQFRQPDPALPAEKGLDFRLGDSIFRKLWASPPSSTTASDGLGPLYNARSCNSCHIRAGRGRPPAPGEAAVSLLFRISIPPRTPEHRALLNSGRAGAVAEPRYGRQLQPFSVQGLLAEPRVTTTWREEALTLADGAVVHLRRPEYRLAGSPELPPPDPQAMLSPRLAPPLIGLGLLGAIPEAQILALADPEDRDGDAIRGRPNRVWSQTEGRPMLGRFGWKAGEATLPDQTAAAFSADLGLSTALLPSPSGDCTAAQADCLSAPHGVAGDDEAEVAPALFDLLVQYIGNLAVPPRRGPDTPEVRRGAAIFAGAGCSSCHHPAFTLADGRRVEAYSDLLLHDMGDGLADHRPDWRAGGRDWRTPPLWGLGLTAAVSGGIALLHDGRARSVLEAILWHDGEARGARERVLGLSPNDRAALLAFLDSL